MVGAKSVVDKSAIGRNCKIGANVKIINSFLWDDVVVEDNVVRLSCSLILTIKTSDSIAWVFVFTLDSTGFVWFMRGVTCISLHFIGFFVPDSEDEDPDVSDSNLIRFYIFISIIY